MRACRFAWALALGAAIVEACGGELPRSDSSPITTGLAPEAGLPPRVVVNDAAPPEAIDAQLVSGAVTIDAPPCSRVFIAAAQGTVSTSNRTLEKGDVLVVKYPDERMTMRADGLALRVVQRFGCTIFDKPSPELSLRRANQAPELTWAGGEMHAHLDIGTDVSPDLYLGRLEGTASVPEHAHEASIEILAAIEAAGTFTLDGKAQRLGPRQILTVPKGATHAWKPDPGSKLVALQMYLGPGPEQRFLALDAAEKDAGARHDVSKVYPNGRPANVPLECWLPYEKRAVCTNESRATRTPSPRERAGVSVECWDPHTQRSVCGPDGGARR